jgi:hypothetical protein
LGGKLSDFNTEAFLTKDAHRIEKGLALAAPKRPFGLAVGSRLQTLLVSSRDAKSVALHPRIRDEADTALQALNLWNAQGLVEPAMAPDGEEIVCRDIEELKAFFASRRSLRNYDPTKVVDQGNVDLAIEMASNTPSVCNRQAGRIHVYRGSEHVRTLLRHQNGNSGFRPGCYFS